MTALDRVRRSFLALLEGHAISLAWADAPYVCPGCHAIDDEPCVAWCPDDAIAAAAHDRDRYFDDCGDDDDELERWRHPSQTDDALLDLVVAVGRVTARDTEVD